MQDLLDMNLTHKNYKKVCTYNVRMDVRNGSASSVDLLHKTTDYILV